MLATTSDFKYGYLGAIRYIMKRLILLVFCIQFAALSFAQHAILKSFSAYRQPNGVVLRWVIKGGNQCNGTRVLRAGDALSFEQINHIPGICGDFTEDETYSFFDSIPISNAYNHYKLELGFQGFSDTITVFFEDFGSKNHLVLTDNSSRQHRILFSNDNSNEALLRVFDTNGNELLSQTTLGNDFTIQPSGWKSGVYLFRISGVSRSDIHGKFYFAE